MLRRALCHFIPSVTIVAIAIIVAGCLGIMWGLAKAHARMSIEAEIRAACAAELRQVEARHPFVATYLKPADPCIALRVVRAGR